MAKKRSRYPGIRSFETNEQHLFNGRALESRELYSMIKVRRSVVLFAKSGIGKTSMLNAGVIPLLEQDHFYAVKARFQNTGYAPVETVKQVIEQGGYINQNLIKKYTKGEPTLWELLKACEFQQNRESAIPVFVFDQFEEFFSHSQADQAAFIKAVADVINERLPEKQRQEFRALPRGKRTKADLEWYSPIDMKIVFSIRSDRLSFLDDLSDDIPLILHSRYHLKPLKHQQARDAIVRPAQLVSASFLTPPFEYKEETISDMLTHLSNEKGEIESFQLQILCQHIENKVAQQQ
ncbi:MAG: hypothetical protein GY810_12995 [Aureispira sp.]|nr:hypothetical protein [Aureispira sp.]